ncbi:MAG: DUF721 domain-containing protein [Bacteroidaceae bacterium]|nr:DUF721 domain-containing protein [Bacteroidaceae bacterium]
MRKSNTESIGKVIQQFLREEGLETPYNQFKLLKALEEVLGQGISHYIGNTFIKNQTLHIEIKSPILRQELTLGRTAIASKLNAAVGTQVIADIRFY